MIRLARMNMALIRAKSIRNWFRTCHNFPLRTTTAWAIELAFSIGANAKNDLSLAITPPPPPPPIVQLLLVGLDCISMIKS